MSKIDLSEINMRDLMSISGNLSDLIGKADALDDGAGETLALALDTIIVDVNREIERRRIIRAEVERRRNASGEGEAE